MFRYSGYGLAIHSEMELPGLPEGAAEPDVVIRFGPVPRTPRMATMEEEIVIHGRAGAFQMVRGREIVLDPLPGANPDLLRILLMGRMMAYLLRQRGWLPLHASGVRIGGQAVLFPGLAGAGKSTTAAAFHACAHQVITDDVSAVRLQGPQCLVRRAGARVRLLDDARTAFNGLEPRGFFQWDKHTFDLACGQPGDLFPVRRIYVLEYGEEIGSEALPPLSAVALLSTHSFVRRRQMNREALGAHLRDCSLVAGSVPVWRLVRPRSLTVLPDLVRFVEMDLGAEEKAPPNRFTPFSAGRQRAGPGRALRYLP